jgi:hypothetical protein
VSLLVFLFVVGGVKVEVVGGGLHRRRGNKGNAGNWIYVLCCGCGCGGRRVERSTPYIKCCKRRNTHI